MSYQWAMVTSHKDGYFPVTRWTLVDRAADRSVANAETALAELLERYLPVLRAYLLNVKRLPRERADDILQGFVTDKILMGDLLSRADRERGKFRTFLLTALERYAISVFRKDNAESRSPREGPLLSLDALPNDVMLPAGAEMKSAIYDLAWIRELIEETLRRIQHDCITTDRPHYWLLFEERVVNPILHGLTLKPYGEMVDALGFTSPIHAANALFTVKRMFERTFRDVVREYTGDGQDVDHEINELRAILAELSAYK